jgi:hypothetical protein
MNWCLLLFLHLFSRVQTGFFVSLSISPNQGDRFGLTFLATNFTRGCPSLSTFTISLAREIQAGILPVYSPPARLWIGEINTIKDHILERNTGYQAALKYQFQTFNWPKFVSVWLESENFNYSAHMASRLNIWNSNNKQTRFKMEILTITQHVSFLKQRYVYNLLFFFTL